MSDRNANKSGVGSSLTDILNGLIARLDSGANNAGGQLQSFSQTTATALTTIGQTATNATQTNSAGGIGKDILNAVNPIAGGGGSATNILTSLFLGPLWKGLFSLFTGGPEDPAPVLTKYQFPNAETNSVAASLSGGENVNTRGDAFGLTRSSSAPQQSINVSIQALDARSILERSDDIAAALKQAMLSNHEINDNLSEL